MDVSLSELWDLVMDRETWSAAIHGVTKSQTRLSDWTELNIKYTNTHIIQVPEGEMEEKEIENIFEDIIAENLPNLKNEIDI